MRFIFSLVIILFLSSANISAADTNKLNFNNKEINELIKNNKLNDIIPKQEKEFDISKYRGLIIIAVGILIFIISRGGFTGFDEEEGRIKKKKSKNNNQSRIDEFIEKSNNKNTDKEREDEFSYDEEDWDSEMQTKANDDFISEIYSEDLKIKIEE